MRALILAMFASLAAACSSFPTPETPREILAVAETSYNGVLMSTLTLHDRGIITDDFLREISDELVAANSVLRQANRVILSESSSQSDVDRVVELLYETIASLNQISADLARYKEGTLFQ